MELQEFLGNIHLNLDWKFFAGGRDEKNSNDLEK